MPSVGKKVLVASGGHKEYLSPSQACEAIAAGLATMGWSSIDLAPMADGGDGLIDAGLGNNDGSVVPVETRDPLYRLRTARMGIVTWNGVRTALIESAEACGAALLKPHERQTMVATSYGLGLIMLGAVRLGCKRLVIGLGGSIVTDCGLGLAQALGFVFLDRTGKEIAGICNPGLSALNLMDVAQVRIDSVDPSLAGIEILVACDVDIPLLGPNGQARTFGPQKYANAMEIDYLEQGLANVAALIQRCLGRAIDVPMAGAAGGMAAGLAGFLGAELIPGAEFVADLIGLEQRIRASDLVIIGEGRLDETTIKNKAPHYVGTLAKRANRPVAAIVGTIADDIESVTPQWLPFFDCLIRADTLYGADATPDATRIADGLTRITAHYGKDLLKLAGSAPI